MMTRKWVSFERDFVADAAVGCLREPRLKLNGNRSSNHRLRCLEDPNDEDEGGANRNRNRFLFLFYFDLIFVFCFHSSLPPELMINFQ